MKTLVGVSMNEEKLQREFLIWFLEKAAPDYARVEPQLNTLSNDFLRHIFARLGKQVPDFESVKTEACHEVHHIRVELDENYIVLLQSLTSGKPSNELLTREVNRELNQDEIETDHLFPIFYKTKYEFTVDESDLIYPILFRKEMLECLFGPVSRGIESERIMRYRNWLVEAEEEFSGFRNKVPSTWGYKEWIGYSSLMEQEMNWGRFGYSPDEKGGRFEFFRE
jgi:hypothetical protein